MDTQDWQALNQQIVARAMQDPTYREALLADPAAALAQAFGQPLPANLKVRIVEQEPDTMYIVLPQAGVSGELSEAELDSVAGGLLATSYPPHPSPVIFTVSKDATKR